MIHEITVTSPDSGFTYTAIERIGGTEEFTLYQASSDSPTTRGCLILKIATEPIHNGNLDREALVLKMMLNEAARLEQVYLAANPGTKVRMNYQFTFPNLVETFVPEQQRSRRVLILSLDCIAKDLSELTPFTLLESKERVRVDQRTSAWILGKGLKSLVFSHGMGITNGQIYRRSILINREEHIVAFFEFSKAMMQEPVDSQSRIQDISQLAKAVTLSLGGNISTGELPSDPQGFDEYTKFLRRLSLGKEDDAQAAHTEFYAMVDKLWPHEFHPFTTYPFG